MKEVLNINGNQVTLVFTPVETKKESFSFQIENNKELTEVLLSSVKTKIVSKSKLRFAIQGIKNILEKHFVGQNTLLTKSEDRAGLYQNYQTKKGCSPVFNEWQHQGNFCARLIEMSRDQFGRGTTKAEARANALKKYFELNQES